MKREHTDREYENELRKLRDRLVEWVGEQPGGFGGAAANPTVDDRVNRRPQLMEWAIGKGYDRFMDGTGKLIMPGEKISWDNHIHAAGEDITSGAELGIWLYPKGRCVCVKSRPYSVWRHRLCPNICLSFNRQGWLQAVKKDDGCISNYRKTIPLKKSKKP